MSTSRRLTVIAGMIAAGVVLALTPTGALAQERLPWRSASPPQDDAYRPSYDERQSGGFRQDELDRPPAMPRQSDSFRTQPPTRSGETYRPADPYRPDDRTGPTNNYRPDDRGRAADAYRQQERPRADDAYRPPAAQGGGYIDNYRSGRGFVGNQPPRDDGGAGYGQPYTPGPGGDEGYDRGYGRGEPPPPPGRDPRGPGYAQGDDSYSQSEIMSAGHRFFGSVSQGLANVIEYAFKQSGRPNGYILGEDAGGAFIAGLRYGEGVLHTKDAGTHKVYWQGPSLGYDFGAEGSKTMVLIYNLRDPSEIYNRFGGVQGSAYVVGGVGIQFQKNEDVVLAPIRAGIGLRLGANVGYLKYTRNPTWNPF
jgi:hypothetical protein